jgi:hypothetical protein
MDPISLNDTNHAEIMDINKIFSPNTQDKLKGKKIKEKKLAHKKGRWAALSPTAK